MSKLEISRGVFLPQTLKDTRIFLSLFLKCSVGPNLAQMVREPENDSTTAPKARNYVSANSCNFLKSQPALKYY